MEKKEIKYNPGPQPGKPKKPKAEKEAKEGVPRPPAYGCLKNGAKPTFRQSRTTPTHTPAPERSKKTIRHFTSFGKKNETVRILIKDSKSFNSIEKEKKKLEKHTLAEVCAYLMKRNLYQAGSDAPEDVLRETYRNAYLAGNVHNNNPDIMLKNYMHGEA